MTEEQIKSLSPELEAAVRKQVSTVKVSRTLEAMRSDQYKDGDIELIDLTAIEEEEPVPDWLNLPDLAFNEIMMKIALVSPQTLVRCTQVCSYWKAKITKNILENQTKMNMIRTKIDRTLTTTGIFPFSEEFCNAKWLSK